MRNERSRRRHAGGVSHAPSTSLHSFLDDDGFRSVIEHVTDLVVIHDQTGVIRWLTPSARQFFGVSDEAELVGTDPLDLIHPDDRAVATRAFSQWLARIGTTGPVRYRIMHHNGSCRLVESVCTSAGGNGVHRGDGGIVVASFEVAARSVRSADRIGAELRLDRAIGDDEIVVHLQRQVDLRTGAVLGFEALARWEHPQRGIVGPDDFIPLAEETGQIVELGRRILVRACADLVALDRRVGGTPWLAVNVSVRQLEHADFADEVERTLATSGLEPGRLWLEITETALMGDIDQILRVLTQIRALGVHLSIDDFGTGWSCLSHLKRFPVEQLKIDRLFTAGVGRSCEDTTIVTSIIDLAHSLGMHVVAEGVETAAQRDTLVSLGCDFGQGFYWGAAIAATDVVSADADAPGPIPADTVSDSVSVDREFEHLVELYASDSFFEDSLCHRLARSLVAGNSVVAIITGAHRSMLERALVEAGIDLDDECRRGRFEVLDVVDTLDRFQVDGELDHRRFHELTTSAIGRATAAGTAVVVYSEIVTHLCDMGLVEQAVELEGLWNEASTELDFTLICGYPLQQFDESNSDDAFREICRLHSHVIPNERYTRLDDAERSLTVAVLQQQVRAGAVARDRLDRRLADLERELEIVRRTTDMTRGTGLQTDHPPTGCAPGSGVGSAVGSAHTIVDLPMFVFADTGRRLSHTNDAGLALFGADPGELLGYHALDFVEASTFTASDPTVSPLAAGAVDAFRARRTLLWRGRVVDAWIWGRTVPSPTGPIVWWTMLPATLAEDHPHRLAFWNSSPTLVTGTLDAAERHEVAVAVDQSIAVGPQGSNGRALAWMHPDDRPLVRRAQRAVANDRRAASCTVRLLHMEGHWVDATCTMIATHSADAPAAVAFICTASPKTHSG